MKGVWKLLISLSLAAAVSAGLLWGGDRLTATWLQKQQDETVRNTFSTLLTADRFEPLTLTDAGAVTEAWRAYTADNQVAGYAVTSVVAGYGGDVEVHTAFSADGTTVKGVRIGAHQETAGYGARIANASFTDQFASRRPPFALSERERTRPRDGQYRAQATGYDSSGFCDTVELTVAGGEITTVNWDAVHRDGGKTKKERSRDGEYVMSETGLPWHEQAEIMERALLEVQDPARIVYQSDTGKTDAYTGATITVTPFVRLSTEALGQAQDTEGSVIDGISGATTSSRAVVTAVNAAATLVARLAAE